MKSIKNKIPEHFTKSKYLSSDYLFWADASQFYGFERASWSHTSQLQISRPEEIRGLLGAEWDRTRHIPHAFRVR